MKTRTIGIDVGLANTAIAVIDGPHDEDIAHLEFCSTDTDHAKRQMHDDHRRLMVIVEWAVRFLIKLEPDRARRKNIRVAIEWYAPRFPQKRGWTTSIVVGGLVAAISVIGYRVVVAKPPYHVQVAGVPKGWRSRISKRGEPHVLDALTHARLLWHAIMEP